MFLRKSGHIKLEGGSDSSHHGACERVARESHQLIRKTSKFDPETGY